MSTTIQIRRDSAANWASVDPVLHQGEIGVETDTGDLKIGDGSTAWTSLAYFAGSGGGAVASVFGRTGTVTAQSGDYTAAQVTGAAPLARSSATISASGGFTAAYTLYYVSAASGNLALTCPAPATVTGITFTFKRTDSTVSTVEFLPYASELIDGASSAWMANSASEISLISDGTNWWTL